MNLSTRQLAAIQASSSLISGVAGGTEGVLTQFQNRASLRALARVRSQLAERDAQERRRLGRLEFEESLRRATELRGEATELDAIGFRNAQAIRAEGRRTVGLVEAQAAASGLRFSGSAAELAAAAAEAAEFAASETLRETSRRADVLLFEAQEVERAGRERRRASLLGADLALEQGRFAAANLRFVAPGVLQILSRAFQPLQTLPSAIKETLLAIRAAQEAEDLGVEGTFVADPFETVDF